MTRITTTEDVIESARRHTSLLAQENNSSQSTLPPEEVVGAALDFERKDRALVQHMSSRTSDGLFHPAAHGECCSSFVSSRNDARLRLSALLEKYLHPLKV